MLRYQRVATENAKYVTGQALYVQRPLAGYKCRATRRVEVVYARRLPEIAEGAHGDSESAEAP